MVFRSMYQFIRSAIATAAVRSAAKVTALSMVFALGATMIIVGAQSVRAQSPSPLSNCSSRYSGSVCMEGETCIFFFCWDWETYWRGEGDGERDWSSMPGGSVWD